MEDVEHLSLMIKLKIDACICGMYKITWAGIVFEIKSPKSKNYCWVLFTGRSTPF